jgi:alpha-tubulin suppressor-like RCC1 family protein/uncharacterized protein YjdB
VSRELETEFPVPAPVRNDRTQPNSRPLLTRRHCRTALLLATALVACHKDATGPSAPVATVAVTPTSTTLAVGSTQPLGWTLTSATGTVLTGRAITFTSSDTLKATVNASGVILAVAVGSATITVTSEGKTATVAVSVVPAIASVTVTPTSASVPVGTTVQLSATVKDGLGNVLTKDTVTWITSSTSTASVSSTGLVTGRVVGSTTITAIAGPQSSFAVITVTSAVVATGPTLTVVPSAATITVGTALQLSVTAKDAAGNSIPINAVTWSSGSPNTAAVSSTGLVTGIAAGAATITAQAGGLTATTAITVTAGATASAPSLTILPGTAAIPIGGSVQLTVTDSLGIARAGTSVSWSSSNAAVATVSATGLVTGLTAGSTIIVAASGGKSSPAAITVNAVSPIVAFSSVGAGDLFSCLVTASSALYCWGNNDAGQLGTGLASGSLTPVAVPGSLVFAAVTTGYAHACATTSDGTAYCWGDNTTGELGNGTTTRSTTPVAVAGGLHFVSLSAGFAHTCGVTAAGVVYCWGDNQFGQLGVLGIASHSSTPVALAVSLHFGSVSAGFDHTCGVASGVAYCWGNNALGQLGTGTFITAPTPAAVAGGNNFVSVSAGVFHSCGVTLQGAALCWGANDAGQLGTGTTSSASTPAVVGGGLSFGSVSAGNLYSCGVATGGAAYCWGDNVYGELGGGTTSTGSATPVTVTGGLNFVKLSAGFYHACGLTTGGTAYCWGDNGQGQLGNGTPFGSAAPVKVAGQP